MKFLVYLNFGVLFLVELAMFAAFFVFGMSLHLPVVLRILVALAIPTSVGILWSMYFAPRARHDLAQPWNALGEYTLFILAGLALIASGHKTAGIVFTAIALVSESISLTSASKKAALGMGHLRN